MAGNNKIEPEPKNIMGYVNLGHMICALTNCHEEALLETPDYPPTGVLQQMRYVRNVIESLDTAMLLAFAEQELNPMIRRFQKKIDNDSNQVGDYYAGQIQGMFTRLWEYVRIEGNDILIYSAQDVGKYDAQRLIQTPRMLFNLPDVVIPDLPVSVDEDLKEAGRCLTVGFVKAAILHTLLATEAVVKYFYTLMTYDLLNDISVSKSVKNKIKYRLARGTWVQMMHNLNDNTKLIRGFQKNVINEALEIGEKFRNKAMHADFKYEEELEVAIWQDCSDLVNMILEELVNQGKCTTQYSDSREAA